MISVIIPTLNSAGTLATTLEALIPAAVQGLVREVIVADGGSSDQTLRIADGTGADTVAAASTRSSRLIAGAQRARMPWLLFLNADGALDAGWEREVEVFIDKVESGRLRTSAAVFKYAVDDEGFGPRAVEALSAYAGALLGHAHAEQGLLIPRTLYTELGGFKPIPIFEDIDLARRLGRRRIVRLKRPLVSSPARLHTEGYLMRSVRHAGCVALFALNVPLDRIALLQSKSPVQASGI
jgi:glycosyltransferase involved in cell wall biosynthesis